MTAVTTTAPTGAPAEAPSITVRGLSKSYGTSLAVDDLDLDVPAGAFLVLLGPSGCGKTTTLRMLAGLERPSAGSIRFGDRSVVDVAAGRVLAPGRRDAGLVFQSYALWPHMTVAANVDWPLKVAGWSRPERAGRVAEVLSLLGIGELGARYPGELSGGQQQRVAIARTIGPRPGVLLFDEPLSNLDAKLRVETRAELLRVHRLTGATSVYVTHDQVEAMTMATHVALMRQGRLEQLGSPQELLDDPASAFVATFMGTPPANVLAVTAEGGRWRAGGFDIAAAAGAAEGTRAEVMLRADRLLLGRAGPGGSVVMEFAERVPMAGRWVVSGWLASRRLTVVTDEAPVAALGDRLVVGLPAAVDKVFPPRDRP